jgi:predicted acyl esterase
MAEGMLRARYRESLSKPSLLQPQQVYRFEIDLVGTSVAFLKGHRIQVHMTSSHFPQFDRNPNTGPNSARRRTSASPSKRCITTPNVPRTLCCL